MRYIRMIETERLFLRKIMQEDIDMIFDINNDPECIRFNGWDSMSLEQCEAEIDKWIYNYLGTDLMGVICVEHIESKDKVGMAYIKDYKEAGEFEIGFRLRSAQWNKGYAKEITRGFIKYAEHRLNAREVIAEVYSANTRSRNVFEKLGFEKSIHPDGENGLMYRYSIDKKK
jgi:RimJ/RimL family protein N-acetyltransferase